MGAGPRGTAQSYINTQQNDNNQRRNDISAGLQKEVTDTQNTYGQQFNRVQPAQTMAPSTSAFQTLASGNGMSQDFLNNFATQTGNVNQAEGNFQSIFNTPVDPTQAQGMLANGSFQNFIDTGGFSNNDLQNIRARSVSPIAAASANANNEINRTRALQGGFSPNTTAALAHSVRDTGYGMADASTNAEANIAQMVQQGKQFGTTGMSNASTNLADLTQRGKLSASQGLASTALAEQAAQQKVAELDAQMKMFGATGLSDNEKAQLQAELSKTNLAADMAKHSEDTYYHNIDQQQAGNMGFTSDEMNALRMPTGFQEGLGNIGSIMGIGGQIAGAATGGFGSFNPRIGNTKDWGNYGSPTNSFG